MKATSVIRHFCLYALAGSLALSPIVARAVTTTPVGLVEAKLQGGTILDSPVKALVPGVRDSVKENPSRSAGIVLAVLKAGRADADAISPQVTAAAIEGLGEKALPVDVGQIVFNAVKSTPAVVLEIVRAAVKASPVNAKVIVRSAARAIPNPQEKIQPIPENTAEKPTSSDAGFTKDDPQYDQKDGDPKDAQPVEKDPLPIAEALAQAAHEADPGSSYQDLLSAAKEGLQEGGGDPGGPKIYRYPPLVVKRNPLSTPPVVSK